MSYDISQQFIEFRKQVNTKIKTTPNQKNMITTPKKKQQEFSVDNLKQSITKNTKRLKVKSSISNIPTSPKKQIPQSPLKQTLKQTIIRQPNVLTVQTQRSIDYIDQQSQIKLYTSKYQKIMSEEQGLYYSQLQTKLDQLSNIIGLQDDKQKNIQEIENMINQNKQIYAKSKVQKNLDCLQFESKILQNDLMSLKTKISRLSDFTDN